MAIHDRPSAGPARPSARPDGRGGRGSLSTPGACAALPLLALTLSLAGFCTAGCEPREEEAEERTPADPVLGALRVQMVDDRLSLTARHVVLRDLLVAVARNARLELSLEGSFEEPVTIDLPPLPVEQAIGRILDGYSYALELADGSVEAATDHEGPIGSLVVFGPAANTDPRGDGRSWPEPALLDEDARAEIAAALANDGSAGAVALLGGALADPSPAVRLEAVSALAGVGGSASGLALQPSLTDPSPAVREAAIEAWGEIGGRAALPALAVALQDREPALRESAVWALQALGDAPGVVGLLQSAALDPDARVRQAALEALEETAARGARASPALRPRRR